MGKLVDTAFDLCLEFNAIDDIANTLRDALQYQADNANPDAQHALVVAEIICDKMNKTMMAYDEFIYKIPPEL